MFFEGPIFILSRRPVVYFLCGAAVVPALAAEKSVHFDGYERASYKQMWAAEVFGTRGDPQYDFWQTVHPLYGALKNILPTQIEQKTVQFESRGKKIKASVLVSSVSPPYSQTSSGTFLFSSHHLLMLMDQLVTDGVLPSATGNDYQDPDNQFYKAAQYIHQKVKEMTRGGLDVHTYDNHTSSFATIAIALLVQKLNADIGVGKPFDAQKQTFTDVGEYLAAKASPTIHSLLNVARKMYNSANTQGETQAANTVRDRFVYAFQHESSGGRLGASGALAALQALFMGNDDALWANWALQSVPANNSNSAWYNQFLLEVLDRVFAP